MLIDDERRILDERARALARPLTLIGAATGAELLHFSVGSEELAIEVAAVREVTQLPEITPVPDIPAAFLGVVNHLGDVLPVIDVLTLIGAPSIGGVPKWLVVIGTRGPEIGLAVASVDHIGSAPDTLDVRLASVLILGVTGGRRLVLRVEGLLADPLLSV